MNLSEIAQKYNYRKNLVDIQKVIQTPEVKSLAWLSLTFFAISFFAIVAIKPTLVTIAKLNREIKEKREANKQLESKIKALVAAQEVFVKNSENLALLDEALPPKNQFPLLAYFFEQKAQEAQVTLKSLSFDKIFFGKNINKEKQASESEILSFNFSLGATGSYQNLRSFLVSLETSPRIVDLESSSLNPVKTKSDMEIISELSISITGQAYFEQK